MNISTSQGWTPDQKVALYTVAMEHSENNKTLSFDDSIYSAPHLPYSHGLLANIAKKHPLLKDKTPSSILNIWRNAVNPKSLGRIIQTQHENFLNRLHVLHPGDYGRISWEFSKAHYDTDGYYSAEVMRNYFGKRGRPEEQSHIDEPPPKKVSKKQAEDKDPWSPDKEQILIKAIKDHPELNVYSDPLSPHNRHAFSTLEKITRATIGKTSRQLREKWVNKLSPKCLGTSIQQAHIPAINSLYQEFGRNWGKISMAFAKTMDGYYYSNNTIKNFILNPLKKEQNPVLVETQDLDGDSDSGSFEPLLEESLDEDDLIEGDEQMSDATFEIDNEEQIDENLPWGTLWEHNPSMSNDVP